MMMPGPCSLCGFVRAQDETQSWAVPSPRARAPDSLGLVDEVISLVPVCQQVRGLLVIHSDVVIGKQAWEEVVDFPGDVQDVINAVGTRRDTLSCHGHQTGTEGLWESRESNPTGAVRFYQQP